MAGKEAGEAAAAVHENALEASKSAAAAAETAGDPEEAVATAAGKAAGEAAAAADEGLVGLGKRLPLQCMLQGVQQERRPRQLA